MSTIRMKPLFAAMLLFFSLTTSCSVHNNHKADADMESVSGGSGETSSQASGVQFNDLVFAQAKEEAKKSGKLIFMDAYTVWCGPCRKMDKEVFTNADVAAYFNENFINLHVDMEKGEGIELSQTFDVQFYPTLLFINAEGQIVHKAIGYQSDKQLIELGMKAKEGI